MAYLVWETRIEGDVVESSFFQSFFGFMVVPRGDEFLHVDVLLKFEVVAHERQDAHLDELQQHRELLELSQYWWYPEMWKQIRYSGSFDFLLLSIS